MTKQLHFKSLLLLCALIVGNLSAWADDTEVTFTLNDPVAIEALGITLPEAGKGTKIESIQKDGVTIAATTAGGKTDTRIYQGSGGSAGKYDFRIYTDGTLTFSAGTLYVKKIIFTGNNLQNLSGDNYSNNTWTGSAESVTLKATATTTIHTITVTIGEPAAVAAPTSSVATGTYIDEQSVELACETEGAIIYYTTNGDTPTNKSEQYTSAISITENTTIKAIAYKGNGASAVTEITITIPTTTFNNFADLISAKPTEAVVLSLKDAQVLAVNGNTDMYVKDASGALDFYKIGLTYEAGQILNGKIVVTGFQLYNTMPEITKIGESQLTVTEGSLSPLEVSSTENINLTDHMCQLIKVSGTVKSGNKLDEILLYTKFKGVTSTNLKNLIPDVNQITVTGIVIPYKSGNDIFLELCPTAISYNITLDKDFVTYCSGNKLDFTESGLTVYTAKAIEGIAELTELPDNENNLKVVNFKTGVILKGTEGVTYSVPMTAENVSKTSGNELVGVTEDTEVVWELTEETVKYNYILQDGVFNKATNKKLKAGKAYLSTKFDIANDWARLEILIKGETTAIEEAKRTKSTSASNIYNLQGQRVNETTKGLYIVNGKKVIMK